MKNKSMQGTVAAEAGTAVAGAGFGAAVGSTIGVVGVFGGMAATWPLALIVGAGGYGFAKIRNLRKENARLKALIAEDLNKVL